MNRPNLEVILMPTMSCNMTCDYCYVLDKYSGVMQPELAKRVIEQAVEYNGPCIPTKVYWHGAEPLLVGIDFYKSICKWTKERYGLDAVQHHIQTNGTLLNEEWFDFFIEYHVTTGVSLDGPPDLHDAYRKTYSGGGTFEIVFNNIMAARRKKLFFDVLCVITRKTPGHEDELFDFFYKHKIDFGFEPLVPENELMARELSITPQEYADVAIKLFDRWFFQSDRRLRMVVPPYHFVTAILKGGNTYCNFSKSCGRHYIAVSPDGQVHSCIMFARHPNLSFGNIGKNSLQEILNSPVRKRFLISRVAHNTECQNCRWVSLCNAGCPHHALVRYGTILHRDAFCESYRQIFEHVYTTLEQTLKPGTPSVIGRLTSDPVSVYQ